MIDFIGRPGWTRTSDHLLRRQVLYPPELRALAFLQVYRSSSVRQKQGAAKPAMSRAGRPSARRPSAALARPARHPVSACRNPHSSTAAVAAGLLPSATRLRFIRMRPANRRKRGRLGNLRAVENPRSRREAHAARNRERQAGRIAEAVRRPAAAAKRQRQRGGDSQGWIGALKGDRPLGHIIRVRVCQNSPGDWLTAAVNDAIIHTGPPTPICLTALRFPAAQTWMAPAWRIPCGWL